jgi:hypothetical protein
MGEVETCGGWQGTEGATRGREFIGRRPIWLLDFSGAPHVSLGENNAWQAAIAEQMGAVLIGHDPKAYRRLGVACEDHWRN